MLPSDVRSLLAEVSLNIKQFIFTDDFAPLPPILGENKIQFKVEQNTSELWGMGASEIFI
jgi:hypothetical protein